MYVDSDTADREGVTQKPPKTHTVLYISGHFPVRRTRLRTPPNALVVGLVVGYETENERFGEYQPSVYGVHLVMADAYIGTGSSPKSQPHATRCVLEDFTRCSDSLLWKLMMSFYDRKGVESWSQGIVPHFITCNAFIGRLNQCSNGYQLRNINA